MLLADSNNPQERSGLDQPVDASDGGPAAQRER